MKISIVGYGKMGRKIENLALQRGHEIYFVADGPDWKSDDISGSDAAIEFSQPSSAVSNIHKCFDAKVPVVVGTTGWYDQLDDVVNQCQTKEGALLASTNFSLGVNIFFEINKKLASLMSGKSDYKVSIEEIHHTQKLDKPSGTAITIAEQIISNHNGYEKWNLSDSRNTSNSIRIDALRQENIPGTHSVNYQNYIDEISISHKAKSREGFAFGAVLAAEFILGKKGVFSMQDVLAIQ